MTCQRVPTVHERILLGIAQEGTGICATPPCMHRDQQNKGLFHCIIPRSVVAVIVSMPTVCECSENIDHAQIILCRTSIPVAGGNELSYSLHAAVVKENVDATVLRDCLRFKDATACSFPVGTS
jgi:hypothetical protein